MRYRKKPVVIDAIQWDGTLEAIYNMPEEFNSLNGEYNPTTEEWFIQTLEGKHLVSKNDYVIRGVKGEFYPCKPDIFEMTYEKV